jgi:hypothetical protein
VQWIGEEEWAFKTNFTVTPDMKAFSHIDLVFEGLDTYSTVKLDGNTILQYVVPKLASSGTPFFLQPIVLSSIFYPCQNSASY